MTTKRSLALYGPVHHLNVSTVSTEKRNTDGEELKNAYKNLAAMTTSARTWKDVLKKQETEFDLARRRTYLKINLDTLLDNVLLLKGQCSKRTEVIGVIKSNAYGHGSVEVAGHLAANDVNHFAVATPWEGTELRTAGIESYIQIFGSACEEEIPTLLEYNLTPTVSSLEFLTAWTHHLQRCAGNCPSQPGIILQERQFGQVVIKVDTGMSRNGCQPEELDSIVMFCEEHGIPVHSIMTHFAQAWDDQQFTRRQLAIFLSVAEKYRSRGIKLHAANTGGILNGHGTDLDFVRPGIAMYGLPPDASALWTELYQKVGLKPVLSWRAKCNLVKTMTADRHVGYDRTYQCEDGDRIATIPVGYADGFNRLLSGSAFITTLQGTVIPVVGRVSMDAISVKLPHAETKCQEFYIMKDDVTSVNSITQLSKQLHTITYEVCTGLASRLPRLYGTGDRLFLSQS